MTELTDAALLMKAYLGATEARYSIAEIIARAHGDIYDPHAKEHPLWELYNQANTLAHDISQLKGFTR